jgi:hypothetical protein
MKTHLGLKGEVGLCDQCVNEGNFTKRPVKRIEEDNIYFCKLHWEQYKESYPYKVSNFLEQVK